MNRPPLDPPARPAHRNYSDVSEGDRRSIYSDPTVPPPIDDPLGRMASRWWRPAVVAAAVVLAGSYVTGRLGESKRAAAARGGEILATVRDDYADMARVAPTPPAGDKKGQGTSEGDREKTRAALDSRLKVLSDFGGVYGDVAALYRTLVAALPGASGAVDVEAVAKAAGEVGGSGDVLYRELAALRAARVLLDAPGRRDEGRERLAALARTGTFVHAAAALSYSVTAGTPEERRAASTLVREVTAKDPSQTSLLEPELKRDTPGAAAG